MAHETRLLIVDNHEEGDEKTRARRLKGFVEALETYNTRLSPHGRVLSWVILPYDHLDYAQVEADGAILTGSGISIEQILSKASLARDFKPQIDLIRAGNMPILGVCFGHQLIAHAFGFSIGSCTERESAIMPIVIHDTFELARQPVITVENHHQREITWVPAFDEVFSIHASTGPCKIQAMKHRVHPLYGVQFHPESLNSRARPDGQSILHAFFDIVVFKGMMIATELKGSVQEIRV